MAVGVGGDDRAGALGEAGGGLVRRDRPSPIVDVREDGARAGQGDGVGCFAKGMGGGDDLVALPYATSLQSQQQTDLAARYRDGVLAAKILRELGLELFNNGSRR